VHGIRYDERQIFIESQMRHFAPQLRHPYRRSIDPASPKSEFENMHHTTCLRISAETPMLAQQETTKAGKGSKATERTITQ
jgi:hypothetical protein